MAGFPAERQPAPHLGRRWRTPRPTESFFDLQHRALLDGHLQIAEEFAARMGARGAA